MVICFTDISYFRAQCVVTFYNRGFTVRILEKYNTQTMLAIIKAERPTHVSLVPQTLKWLMDAGLSQPFSIEKILLGGCQIIIHAD